MTIHFISKPAPHMNEQVSPAIIVLENRQPKIDNNKQVFKLTYRFPTHGFLVTQ